MERRWESGKALGERKGAGRAAGLVDAGLEGASSQVSWKLTDWVEGVELHEEKRELSGGPVGRYI